MRQTLPLRLTSPSFPEEMTESWVAMSVSEVRVGVGSEVVYITLKEREGV